MDTDAKDTDVDDVDSDAGSFDWELQRKQIKLNDTIYLVSRARAPALSWAFHARLDLKKVKWVSSMGEIAHLTRDTFVKVLLMGIENAHWLDEVNEHRLKFQDVQFVRI